MPAWFDRGTRRPHPAGRAFLALVGCAAEGLSARRFAEYLSLGQVPPADGPGRAWEAPPDDVLGGGTMARDLQTLEPKTSEDETPTTTGNEAAPAGTLRTPRRWEHLLVEASVVGGDAARWRRRIAGLEEDFDARLREARREDPESARARGLGRDLESLKRLREFALPLIDEMSGWGEPGAVGALARASRAPRPTRAAAFGGGGAGPRRSPVDVGGGSGGADAGARRGSPTGC